jgi:hypothetical protein
MAPRIPARRVLSALTALLVVTALAAGCGDDEGDSDDAAGESSDEFCQARTDMNNALGDLVDPADSADLDQSLDEVQESYDELQDAAGDDLQDEVDALGDAIGSLDDAATASEGESVGARLETLGNSVSDVGTALDDLVSAAARDC